MSYEYSKSGPSLGLPILSDYRRQSSPPNTLLAIYGVLLYVAGKRDTGGSR